MEYFGSKADPMGLLPALPMVLLLAEFRILLPQCKVKCRM